MTAWRIDKFVENVRDAEQKVLSGWQDNEPKKESNRRSLENNVTDKWLTYNKKKQCEANCLRKWVLRIWLKPRNKVTNSIRSVGIDQTNIKDYDNF